MIVANCRFADDVLYDTDSNSWVRFEADGSATVGINSVLAWLGGPVNSVSFKATGTQIERGKGLGAVESARHFDTVRSPISGRLVAVNEELLGNPRLLNHDPYVKGWFATLEPSNPEEKRLLRSPEEARPQLQARISELKIHCFAEFPDYEMFEIGTECSAVLVRLDEFFSSSPRGTVVHLVSDDPTSEIEMIRWTDRTGNEVLERRREGNIEHFIVKKTQA